jgi:hypothetical protein
LPAAQPEGLLREKRLDRNNGTIQAQKTADRLKTHPFSILKTSQMFARDNDLISSDGSLLDICICHSCVRPLFLDAGEPVVVNWLSDTGGSKAGMRDEKLFSALICVPGLGADVSWCLVQGGSGYRVHCRCELIFGRMIGSFNSSQFRFVVSGDDYRHNR